MIDDRTDGSSDSSRPWKLTYGPTPPWHRTPEGKRTAVLMGVVVLTLCTWVFGPPLLEHIELLRMQRDALKAIVHRGDAPVLETDSLGPSHVPSAWSVLYKALSAAELQSDGTVLIARRNRPGDGRELIVAVDLHRQPALGGSQAIFAVGRVIQPGTLLHRPRLIHPGELQLVCVSSDPLRVFTGRIDSNDFSRFIFRIEAGEREHIVDGWLTEGGQVLFKPRE